MPQIKSLLRRTEVQVAKRRRECKHSKATISKGERCLVVIDPGMSTGPSYCNEISMVMIAQARAELDWLEQRLSS